MANIFDYLDWRGDITFKQSPLNEVDFMIFSWLSYVEFDHLVPENIKEKGPTLTELSEQFFADHDLEKILADTAKFTRTAAELLKRCGECERFKDVRVSGFAGITDRKIEVQFAAMVFHIGKFTHVITYRGTDESIVGWKEDFNMAYMEEVPGQKLAVKYLNYVGEALRGSVYTVGHSKGGNLAIYAPCKVKKHLRERVKAVYNFDGPGFEYPEALGEGYLEITPKVHSFVPESSMVGILLNGGKDAEVVPSTEKLINQHNVASWQVLGTQLMRCEKLSRQSTILDVSVSNWIKSLEPKARGEFIDAVFKIVEADDVHRTDEIKDPIKYARSVLKEYSHMPKETKKMITKVIGIFFKEGRIAIKQSFARPKAKVSNFLIDSKQ